MASRSSRSARPRGRREHRKRVTRRELLAAGRRLFGESGLYESRIEDLSRLAGVAKGTLYGYFANKLDLIEAVVTDGFSELLGHVHRHAQRSRSHVEVVTRVVEAHLRFFEENPDLMRVFHQVRGLIKFDRPEGRPLRRVLANYLAGLAHVLALHPRRARGQASHRDLATLLFGAVSGISSTRASVAAAVPRSLLSRATVRALVALALAYEGRPAPGTRGSLAAARASRRVPGFTVRHRPRTVR